MLGRKLEQWRVEEDIVSANVEKHRQSLVEVLRQGEKDAHSLQQHIKVHSFNNLIATKKHCWKCCLLKEMRHHF